MSAGRSRVPEQAYADNRWGPYRRGQRARAGGGRFPVRPL